MTANRFIPELKDNKTLSRAHYLTIRIGIGILLVLFSACSSVTQRTKGNTVSIPADKAVEVVRHFSNPRRIAVLVGINKFHDSRWNDLNYASKDAHDMASVLSRS